MIVDDSAYNLFVLKELLTLIKDVKEIVQALNGQEALDIIVNNLGNNKKSTFDIIIIDLHMPIMDGFKVTRSMFHNLI